MSEPNYKILGDDFGFVFEIGINVGILAGIRHLSAKKKIVSKVHSLYYDELKAIKLSHIVSLLRNKAIKNDVFDPTLLKKMETFIEYLLFLGVHKGFNFMVEYCQSLQAEKRVSKKLQLLYFQCDLQQLLNTDNQIRAKGLIPKLETMFKQFNCPPPPFQKYSQSGDFFKADTIMLFHWRDKYRVVVIDVGLFSVADINHVPNLQDVPAIKQRLLSTYHYMREKTAFESINIESEKVGISSYSPKLKDYFEAFSRDDKDTEKMIQAGGYAYSFVQCLKKLQPERFNEESLEVHAIGLTDRAYNAIFISQPENLQILQIFSTLEIFQQIYKDGKEQSKNLEYPEKRAYYHNLVFERIYKEFERTLKNNKTGSHPGELEAFVEQLKTVPSSDTEIYQAIYTETLKDFYSTADKVPPEIMVEVGLNDENSLTFRQAHTQLITNALNNKEILLFLTGHPGIGKTTAIVENILSEQILSEGVLFFYFSPRLQVNYDIIEKVTDRVRNGKRILKDDNLICIDSNSTLMDNYGGYPVIKYVCNSPLPVELKIPPAVRSRKSILKLVANDEDEGHYQSKASNTQSCSDTQLDYNSSNATPGVLNTICSAICTLRQEYEKNHAIPKNIIATATVQSLKKTEQHTTAQHLRKIFAEADKKGDLKDFDDTKLKQIAKTTQHIIFMVDEVIGDTGGAELLSELVNLSQQLNLKEHFHLKIIASDASIAGKDVIQQHLLKQEPSPAKILYRLVHQSNNEKPLSMDQDNLTIGIYNLGATLINANTFPARDIVLSYKVSLEMASMETQRKARYPTRLQDDLFNLLREPARNGQIIVYIQDIQRLKQLIQTLKEKKAELPAGKFEEFTDYLLIHAYINDEARKKIHPSKNTVKVIFMTSSASRGITFAGVRHILIEVPKFQIEYNLMEIIQTVYRGRGGETQEERKLEQKTRWLTFYLPDRIHYFEREQRKERYQKNMTALMNMILLVRTALKTRIVGYGDIGHQDRLRIIPVSGKHVDSVGHSLLIAVARLLEEIRKEIRRNLDSDNASYDQSLVKLRQDIKNIFVHTQTRVANDLLKEVNTYYDRFVQRVTTRLYDVLVYDFKPEYYIDGDILTMPINRSEERIRMSRDMLNTAQQEKLVARMHGHTKNPNYADSLKMALKKMAKEINQFQKAVGQTNKSQDVYSRNTSRGQYLSIPFPVFFKPDIFQKYFKNYSETESYEESDSQEDMFHRILGGYLNLLYPINDKLPLDGRYEKLPFLLFRCDNFLVLRQQRFDKRYLFSSTSFNMINLILSQDS